MTNDKPALVCLHGWGVSSTIWQPLRVDLADAIAVHAPDLPGHGDASLVPGGLGEWTDAVLDDAPERAVYLAWSLGGLVCLDAAWRHPERVQGLILVDALPRMLRDDGWRWGMKATALAKTAQGLQRDYEKTLQDFLTLQILAEPGARQLIDDLRTRLFANPPSQQGLLQGLEILRAADLRSALPTIDAPVLVVNGAHDRMCHPDGARWMAQQLPRARQWIVPRAGHAPFLSHQAAFSARVSDFVLQHSGAA